MLQNLSYDAGEKAVGLNPNNLLANNNLDSKTQKMKYFR